MSVCTPSVWQGLDRVMLLWRAGRYMQGARWMLEYSVVPLFAFPLCVAAAIKVTRFMESATVSQHFPWERRVLSAVISTVLSLATFCFIWLPGPFIINLMPDDTLRLGDFMLLVRYIFLAYLTSNVMLLPRASPHQARARGAALSTKVVSQTGMPHCQQLGHSSKGGRLPTEFASMDVFEDRAGPSCSRATPKSPMQAARRHEIDGAHVECAKFVGPSANTIASI
eukprot:TRINITY_DN31211_c2_g1_i1.p1 TRINITY_DN31211_c2_g1~~TRINITY_DN31211_c2_g1_i1.p1  ORF type:complete len:225 (+),score=9.31 TRINITY_DN31211_c2_g1_i1:955-1629(+)